MIQEMHLEKTLSFSTVRLDLYPVGKDILAVLSGSDVPHIGCAVLAMPRESLRGDGTISCTSSVVNLPGHKDELICRRVAEALCVKHGVSVTCTGGFHIDHITGEQIKEVLSAVDQMIGQMLYT